MGIPSGHGDQYNLYGDHNIGHQVNNGVRADVGEITELALFVAHLSRLGLVTEAGVPTDPQAIENEVAENRPRLAKVAAALRRGASQSLSTTLNQVVVPVVLKLVEKQFSL